jgi:hypothetical protein
MIFRRDKYKSIITRVTCVQLQKKGKQSLLTLLSITTQQIHIQCCYASGEELYLVKILQKM